MKNKATITIRFDYASGEVVADCCFELDAAELRFSLSDAMYISNAGLKEVRELYPRWGHPSIEYVADAVNGALTFSYRGRAEGWCNIIVLPL